MHPWFLWALLCLSAFLAGAINAVAGGGTLLTFPALIAALSPTLGPVLSLKAANTTSTVALVPGSVAGAWGFRNDLAGNFPWLRLLLGPCLVGGLVGSLLLLHLPEGVFATVIPWLLLLAALLFMLQPLLNRYLKRQEQTDGPQTPVFPGPGVCTAIVIFMFLVGVYGGYFGAGVGILTLSALGLMGLHDIHAMNAIKTILASVINLTSVAVFVAEDGFTGKVIAWQYGPVMAIASIVGGYAAARLSRRLPRSLIRWTISGIGLGLAGVGFGRQLGLIKF